MKLKHQHPVVGYILATVGVLFILVEAGLHTYGYFSNNKYEIDRWVLLIGAVIGFVGFWMINSTSTTNGLQVLSGAVIGIIRVVRTGKRDSDVAVVVEQVDPPTSDPDKDKP